MPTRLHVAAAALLFPMWQGGTLFAQESQAPITPLRELMERLETANPDVLAARYRFEAATKRPSQVSTLPDPRLTLVNFGVGLPISRLNADNFAYRGIGISQELPFPGKLALAGEEARKEAESERQMYRAVLLEKSAQLKVAYFEWFGAVKAIEVTTKTRDLLERFEEIARARYTVGRGIQPDILRAQAEISGLAQRIELLGQRKAIAEARIRSLLNGEIALGRPADVQPSPFELGLDRILEILEESSPQLQAGEAIVESRAVGIDRARRDLKPDFNVAFQWQKTGSRFPDYYMATFEIKLPVFASRKQHLGVEESVARFQESRQNYESARQELVFQAKDFYLTAKTSERLLALYRSGIIPQTSLALESALTGYEVGTVDFLTLMTSAMSLLDYETQYYEEVAKHEQALAQLEPLLDRELTQPRP